MASTKVPVAVTLRKPGAQPPVYIAGTFSEPPWQPQEMDSSVVENGHPVFKARLLASPGTRIQYKFKTAQGDWFLDENATSVDDYRGFRNNSIDVPRVPTITHQHPASQASPGGNASLGATADWLDLDPFAKRSKGRSTAQDWDTPQDRIPLFAHECFIQDSPASASGSGMYSLTNAHCPSQVGFDHEPDTSELSDPALERFPSRLDEISELIHKVEEDLEEDETEIEGVPPSAVLGMPRSKTNDIVGEFLGGSPVTSPIQTRPPKRLDVIPRSSAHSDVSASLLSISEGVEEDGEDRLASPLVLQPSPDWRSNHGDLHPLSEDDEAVIMSDGNAKMFNPSQPTPPINKTMIQPSHQQVSARETT